MSKKISWKKYRSLFLIIILFIQGILFLVFGSSASQQTNIQYLNNPNGNDWWPMFHHDLLHSGLSTSAAPEDNQVMWSYQTNYFISSSPAVSHGRVYIGSWDSNLYCFDMDSGNLLWNFSTNGEITSSPAVAYGKVYVGSEDTNLYCLNANDGTLLWDFRTNYIVESSPAVADGKVFFGSNDGSLYCLNADDGTLLWRYQTDNVILSSPAISNGKVYCGTTDGNYFCLDSTTGNILWLHTIGDGTYSSPTIDDCKMYIGTNDKNVYCFDASDGTVLWNYSVQNEVHSSPAIAGDYLYIGISDGVVEGRLLCLQKDTGTYVWSYQVYGGVECSPAVADGKVYFGSDPCCGFPGYLFCLNAVTGAEIWQYDFNTEYHMKSSPAVAAGKVFVGSADGKLYTFGDVEYLADANGPYYSNVNSSVDFTGSVYGGNPGFSWYWDFGDSSTSTEQNPTHTYTAIGEYPVTLHVTDNEGTVASDETTAYIEPPNNPPTVPVIHGTSLGIPVTPYTYTFTSLDFNGDFISYFINWGDNTTSGWNGPFPSGIALSLNHTWSERGSYFIRAKAKDTHGAESNWSDPFGVIVLSSILSVDIHGGFGITMVITNLGTIPATNILWNITFIGNHVFPTSRSGAISFIQYGGEGKVRVIVFGVGKITITAQIRSGQGIIANTTKQAFLFLIFVH